MAEHIQKLIELIIHFCSSWIQQGKDGLLRFVDPNDGEEISAHYGATHAAVAFVIWGRQTCNDALYNQGLEQLKSVLKDGIRAKNFPPFISTLITLLFQ